MADGVGETDVAVVGRAQEPCENDLSADGDDFDAEGLGDIERQAARRGVTEGRLGRGGHDGGGRLVVESRGRLVFGGLRQV